MNIYDRKGIGTCTSCMQEFTGTLLIQRVGGLSIDDDPTCSRGIALPNNLVSLLIEHTRGGPRQRKAGNCDNFLFPSLADVFVEKDGTVKVLIHDHDISREINEERYAETYPSHRETR